MAKIVRWKPFLDLMEMKPFPSSWPGEREDSFQELLESARETRWTPRMETYRKNGNYVIKADLPGVEGKDVHVSVEAGYLNIRGERKMDKETKRSGLRRREVFYGSFQRLMPIPTGLKVEEMKAEYHKGVLEITAPLRKGLPSKEIKVEAEKET